MFPQKLAGTIADVDSPEAACMPWAGELEAKVLGVGGAALSGAWGMGYGRAAHGGARHHMIIQCHTYI